jgi:ribosome-binding factor A
LKERAYPRSTRIADMIKEEVANIFLKDISDPRLQNITITAVNLSPDLKLATIYYVLPSSSEDKELSKCLDRVKGFIRKQISQSINMRRTPELEFCYDDVFERGMNMEKILRGLKNAE